MVMPDVEQVIRRTATTVPRVTQNGTGAVSGDPYGQGYDDAFGFWTIAQFADDVEPWGINIRLRDLQLRQFLPTSNLILSAFTTVAARNAAFAWTFDGGERVVARAQRILQEANLGGGWRSLMIRLTIDLLSQDNGAFIEVVRERDSPDSRTIALLNMDAGRCLGRDTRVWMADGRKVPVLDVVRSKDEGPVLSVGPTGELEAKRITAWHSSNLGERCWMQLRLASSHRAFGRSEGMWLTNDHEVLTPDGYVRAESLTLASRVLTADPEPNNEQMEVLIGTLLGDAGLSRRKRGVSVSLGHTIAQREWLELKVHALDGMGFSPVRGTRFLQTSSLATPALAPLYEAFYPNGGTKVVPRDLVEQYFSPRMLATWFADDGNRAKGKWGRSKGRIYTYGFSEDDTAWLAKLLTQKGYTATTFKRRVTTGPYSGRVYTGIYVTAAGAERLFADVAPFMPTCMRHKVAEGNAEFDPALWNIGHANRYAAAVESIERGLNGEQATAYCIDVEDNHNFVAANTVVHNCWRTGDPRNPVLYTALDGTYHLLPWYRVLLFEEMPSGIERLRGLQYSALTRILQAALIYRDMQQYVREKVSGRNPSSITFVGGVGRKEIEDAQARMNAVADNEGRYRYGGHIMIPGLSPERQVNIETLDLKGVPDGFNAAEEFNRFIDSLAMALLIDRQDLAPLTGGNLGTSTQSEVLSRKTRGKGPALFQKMIEDKFNFFNIFGEGVTFRFEEQDAVQEREEAEARKVRADVYKVYYDMGMPATTIWQMMADSGDLDEEYLALMDQQDVTDDVTVTDEEPAENQSEMTAEAAVDAVVEANPLAQIATRAKRPRTEQHDAMDAIEGDATREFGHALASVRDEFAAAVKRQLPKVPPAVAEVRAVAERTDAAIAAQGERVERAVGTLVQTIDAAARAQTEAAEATASAVVNALRSQAISTQATATEAAKQQSDLAAALRELARPRRRRIVRDADGRPMGTEEEIA